MLQVKNETPFVPGLFVFPDPRTAVDTVYLAVKATFSMTPKVKVAEQQLPLVPGDQYWGDPGASSVRFAGEAHPCKLASDVVLLGHAHAPGGKPSPRFGLSLGVGKLRKIAQVHGERVWKAGALGATPSSAIPVDKIPLQWERAYGGRHDLPEGRFLAEMRNPVGLGFRGKRSLDEMNGTRVPNLEDPRKPVSSLSDPGVPHGFGWVAPSWLPRTGYAGTYDQAWQKRRAPYFPADFDLRFFQAAPPDQVYPGFLAGGEPVELLNCAPEGVQRFALPVCRLDSAVWIAGRAHKVVLRLESLVLEPDQHRFSLLFRGAVPCDKRALQVEVARVGLKSLEGVDR
ncbi:MAG: DUF2169 domain-containing protein [Deltaproteobacteria bacterium]|nr:DUF2169 domain-containing protein [Deltaproteobacteria bacterium]